MEILPAAVQAYAEEFTSAESPVLYNLNRFTNLKVPSAHMLSGKVQGQFLSMLSKFLRPRRILEIGTFTGYSAICLAHGLVPDGILYTIDNNEELKDNCLEYISKAGLQDKIKLLTGNAAEIIPTLQEKFDLVFIDADKINYAAYFDLVIDKVNAGGCILADNVLFHGEVLASENTRSSNARAIHAFNQKIAADSRVEQVLLTIRDGLLFIRKK